MGRFAEKVKAFEDSQAERWPGILFPLAKAPFIGNTNNDATALQQKCQGSHFDEATRAGSNDIFYLLFNGFMIIISPIIKIRFPL